MTRVAAPAPAASELRKRVVSAIVMGIVAIAATVLGGWTFALLWSLVAAAVAWEWQRMVGGGKAVWFAHVCAAAAGAGALAGGLGGSAAMVGVGLAAALAPVVLAREGKMVLAAEGQIYAFALGASVILCRAFGDDGVIVVFWLFAVVWGTDIVAFFTGRTIGGPKLWPRVSPRKTWSGALGGLIGGAALGCMLLAASGLGLRWQHGALAIVFSLLTQAGDLFESALKRRFAVKDSGRLIPGHGGFMDRLDGFIFAVSAAAVVGALRNGWDDVPAGLLFWP